MNTTNPAIDIARSLCTVTQATITASGSDGWYSPGWLEPPPSAAGVREPRRPLHPTGSGAVSLPLPIKLPVTTTRRTRHDT